MMLAMLDMMASVARTQTQMGSLTLVLTAPIYTATKTTVQPLPIQARKMLTGTAMGIPVMMTVTMMDT